MGKKCLTHVGTEGLEESSVLGLLRSDVVIDLLEGRLPLSFQNFLELVIDDLTNLLAERLQVQESASFVEWFSVRENEAGSRRISSRVQGWAVNKCMMYEGLVPFSTDWIHTEIGYISERK